MQYDINETNKVPDRTNGTRGENHKTSDPSCDLAFGETPPLPPRDAAQSRPRIIINDRQDRDLIKELNNALQGANVPPKLFDHDGKLVELDVAGSIRDVNANRLLVYSTLAADFFKIKGVACHDTPPPKRLAISLLHIGASQLGFPRLHAVISTPVHRTDGSLVRVPGYDQTSGLFYQPPPDLATLRIPRNPTRGDAECARDSLYDLLVDFRFADHASKSNFLGALITPALHYAIGHRPLIVVRAQNPNSGKSTLCDTISLVYQGKRMAPSAAPEPNSLEWEKKLFPDLQAGLPFIFFGNVDHELESEYLAEALTSENVRSRILGKSKNLTVTNRAMFVVNGNAELTVGKNLARRSIWIRIDNNEAFMGLSAEQIPWTHKAYHEHVCRHRAQFLRAILTMTSAWYAAGSPAARTPVIDSFESWSRKVGGVLEYAGVPGFLDNYREMIVETEREMEAFLLGAYRVIGSNSFTTKDLLKKMRETESLLDSIPSELSRSVADATALGKALHTLYGRSFGESRVRLERKGHNRDKVVIWQIIVPPPK